MTSSKYTVTAIGSSRSLELLEKRFTFPDIAGKRVLIVAVGGGCDIISAFAVVEMLRELKPAAPAEIVYANTKRDVDESLTRLAQHIYLLPKEVRRPIAVEFVHGTTQIDACVQRGDRGCPWILRLPRDDAGQRELVRSLQHLGKWDLVLTIDTGADSIVATAESGADGRDKTMLRLLRTVGMPLYHIVVGPGCDGETSFADLHATFQALIQADRYLGCFPLDAMIPSYRKFATSVAPDRTPNILLAALDETLQRGRNGGLIVPRGMWPEIPRGWLTHAFVIQ